MFEIATVYTDAQDRQINSPKIPNSTRKLIHIINSKSDKNSKIFKT